MHYQQKEHMKQHSKILKVVIQGCPYDMAPSQQKNSHYSDCLSIPFPLTSDC